MTTTEKTVAYITGPQHYVEAETLLAQGPGPYETAADVYAFAQVHATLALAAATAATITVEGDRDDWAKAGVTEP